MANNASRKLKERNRKIFYWLMISLPLLQFFIFYICVNINSLILAFKSYSVTEGESFVFLDNFATVIKAIFKDTSISTAFTNSAIVWFVGLCVGSTLALFFSFYVYKKYFGSGLFRVMLFMPQIISSIVLVIMFRYFMVYALPEFLEPFGTKVPDLLADPNTAWGTILFYTLWTGFGTSTMMYVGAMNNISDSIVEYAKLDGFTPMKEFIFITVPMVFPTVSTFITVGLAAVFTNQMALYQFYAGNAEPQLWTVGYYLYVSAQKAGNAEYPYLSAFGLVLTFITAPVTLIVKKLLEKYGPGVN